MLAGEIVSNTVLAFAQMALYAGIGLLGLSFTKYGSFLSGLGGPIRWFLVFFVAGFAALACLWAVAGALASRSEDLRATTAPLTTIVMAIFFQALMVRVGRHGRLVHPADPVPSRCRWAVGRRSRWQPVVALLLLVAFAGLTHTGGERIYRRRCCRRGAGRHTPGVDGGD